MSRHTAATVAASLGTVALAVAAAARISRLVTTDKLGDWAIVQPAKRWAAEREPHMWHRAEEDSPLEPLSGEVLERAAREHFPGKPQWRTKLVQGLECPFCWGFWASAGVTVALAATRGRPAARRLWETGAGVLGLSYVVGHLSSRID